MNFSKIRSLLASHADFIKQAFSDSGTPSSSRVLTAVHSVAAIFVLIYLTVKTKKYPGVDEATGLGVFATVHYGVNKVSGIFGQKKDKPDQIIDPAQNLEVKK